MEKESEGSYQHQRWVVSIESVTNGIIVRDSEGRATVFEVDEDDSGADMGQLLPAMYHIMEAMGYINQKYAKTNLSMQVEHGRGYECKSKKGCPICQKKD